MFADAHFVQGVRERAAEVRGSESLRRRYRPGSRTPLGQRLRLLQWRRPGDQDEQTHKKKQRSSLFLISGNLSNLLVHVSLLRSQLRPFSFSKQDSCSSGDGDGDGDLSFQTLNTRTMMTMIVSIAARKKRKN